MYIVIYYNRFSKSLNREWYSLQKCCIFVLVVSELYINVFLIEYLFVYFQAKMYVKHRKKEQDLLN